MAAAAYHSLEHDVVRCHVREVQQFSKQDEVLPGAGDGRFILGCSYGQQPAKLHHAL